MSSKAVLAFSPMWSHLVAKCDWFTKYFLVANHERGALRCSTSCGETRRDLNFLNHHFRASQLLPSISKVHHFLKFPQRTNQQTQINNGSLVNYSLSCPMHPSPRPQDLFDNFDNLDLHDRIQEQSKSHLRLQACRTSTWRSFKIFLFNISVWPMEFPWLLARTVRVPR